MKQHPRMYKSLGCLAASMIGGALMLEVLEPPRPATPIVPDPTTLRNWAREAVTSQETLVATRWREIELVSYSRINDNRFVALAAIPAERDYHFLVDSSGRMFTTQAWDGQRAVPGRYGTIRVGVAGAGADAMMSELQRRALRVLLDELQTRLGAGGGKRCVIRFGSVAPPGFRRASFKPPSIPRATDGTATRKPPGDRARRYAMSAD